MTITVVKSSAIKAVEYHPHSHALDVYFTTGKTVQYKDVPKDVYQSLIDSDSVGTYFNFNIRNNYKTQSID